MDSTINSPLFYICRIKSLRPIDKLLLGLAAESYRLGNEFHPRIRTLMALLSCSRAETFRTLDRVGKRWLARKPRERNLRRYELNPLFRIRIKRVQQR